MESKGTTVVASCIHQALTDSHRYTTLTDATSPVVDAVALGLGVALNIAWGASFIAATIIGDSARGWVSAVGYFSIAALVLWAVWRGKRGDVHLEEDA